MINLLNSAQSKTIRKVERFSFLFLFLFLSPVVCFSQTSGGKAAASQSAAKSSPAYAEILLLKTELEAQLEDFAADYTDNFPKAKELRFQLDLIQKETNKLLAVNAANSNKLSVALGKLIIRKIELETDLWNLRNQYKDDYPQVKRAKRKVEVFEKAIKEILP
jgi:hypothetical protein